MSREFKCRIWDDDMDRYDYFTPNSMKMYIEIWSRHMLKGREIEQYTGLKDKNGVEIYEFDILDIRIDEPVQVFWQSASFMVSGGWLSGDDLCIYNECAEIIGHIHKEQTDDSK